MKVICKFIDESSVNLHSFKIQFSDCQVWYFIFCFQLINVLARHFSFLIELLKNNSSSCWRTAWPFDLLTDSDIFHNLLSKSHKSHHLQQTLSHSFHVESHDTSVQTILFVETLHFSSIKLPSKIAATLVKLSWFIQITTWIVFMITPGFCLDASEVNS